MAAGVVYAFFGFRLFRFLLAISCGGLGYLAGAIATQYVDVPELYLCAAGAVLFCVIAAKWERVGVVISAAATWALLGGYLSMQLGIPRTGIWITMGVTGLLGMLFALLCYRTTTVVLTTLQGVVIMIVGFVTVSTKFLPAIGTTFTRWANSQSLLVPVFLIMLFAAAYSYQTMHQQGDIRTGR
jgi:hypothetical protein